MACAAVNTLRPRQNGRYFADDSFKRMFLSETLNILIENSLKFAPNGLINNIPALVQIMAWRRPNDKSLSEPMVVRIMTHICGVTRPKRINHSIYNIRQLFRKKTKHCDSVQRLESYFSIQLLI